MVHFWIFQKSSPTPSQISKNTCEKPFVLQGLLSCSQTAGITCFTENQGRGMATGSLVCIWKPVSYFQNLTGQERKLAGVSLTGRWGVYVQGNNSLKSLSSLGFPRICVYFRLQFQSQPLSFLSFFIHHAAGLTFSPASHRKSTRSGLSLRVLN